MFYLFMFYLHDSFIFYPFSNFNYLIYLLYPFVSFITIFDTMYKMCKQYIIYIFQLLIVAVNCWRIVLINIYINIFQCLQMAW